MLLFIVHSKELRVTCIVARPSAEPAVLMSLFSLRRKDMTVSLPHEPRWLLAITKGCLCCTLAMCYSCSD
jgi:G3E family GTPase